MNRQEKTILIVEDNPAHIELIVRAINNSRQHFNVMVAKSLGEAQFIIKSLKLNGKKLDLIIADVILPDGLGTDLLPIDKNKINIPLIVMTSHGSEELAKDVIKAGALDYIVKSPNMFDNMPIIAKNAIREWKHIMKHRKDEKALLASEERYRTIFEQSRFGIVNFDQDSIIIDCNNKFAEIEGTAKKELIGKNLINNIRDKSIRLAISNSLNGNIGVYEGKYNSFNGKKNTYIKCYFRCLSTDEGKPLSGIGVIEDISKQKYIEQEKNKMLQEFQQKQKMESIGQLAGGVAHDFNNLLTVINGYAQLLLQYPDMSEDVIVSLKEIKKAGNIAASLTAQLLSFSRKQMLHTNDVEINIVIESISGMLKRLISEDILIKKNLTEDLPLVNADTNQLQQVIINLVVNARDAMLDGGIIFISTKLIDVDKDSIANNLSDHHGSFIEVEVRDTGIGMDEKIMEKVFEPFFTTKEVGKGTGLGLAMVYGTIQQHNGWINLSSKLGEGTSFKIYLPIVKNKTTPIYNSAYGVAELDGNGENILLVEDAEGVQKYAESILRAFGYNVLKASNANDAIEIFEKEKDNLCMVFSDVVLPDTNGVQLIEKMQSIQPEIPFLLCSGYSNEKSRWSVINEKKYPFIQKPYSQYDLLNKIKEILNVNKVI